MKRINVIISGLGNIGSRFVSVLRDKQDYLHHLGLDVRLIAAADVDGGAINLDGLDLETVANLNREKSISTMGEAGLGILDILDQVQADVFFEATRVNLVDGEPGMSAMRKALQRGMHVITTNKGPLALAYSELASIAKEKGVKLRHCGAVFGGLPAVSIAERDLAGSTMLRLEAQANLANSFILDRMRAGISYADAVQAAKDQGCADQDETLDVDGWDAVVKLVIFANSVLGLSVKIDDVDRVSIRDISPEEVNRHTTDGNILKYLAIAERKPDGKYSLSAKPVPLPMNHGLAGLGALQMGVAYTTDLFGTITASIVEETPLPSASTMLRDLLIIYADQDNYASY